MRAGGRELPSPIWLDEAEGDEAAQLGLVKQATECAAARLFSHVSGGWS
jgi:hypothetical protein